MSSLISIQQQAHRMCIYIGESDRWRGKPLYAAILDALKVEGIAGATVVRGVAGFGAHSRIHTAAILRLSEDLPLCIEVIDSPEKIAQALDMISPMVTEGLITLEPVQVVRYTHRYLNPLPADKPVAAVMTREVITLQPEWTIAEAWERMLEHLIKAMPVVEEDGKVVGMLTDEDLLCCAGIQQRLSVAERLDAETLSQELASMRGSPLKVADVMTRPAITTQANEPLGLAAARMAKHGIKRLPVVNDTGRLIGVLSRVDVLRQAASSQPKTRKLQMPGGAARTLQDVMSPEVPLVQQDADLATVVNVLLETGSRRLIVADDEGRTIGLISDADVVSRIQPQERRGVLQALQRRAPPPASSITAQKLMSPGALSASPDTPVVEAVRMMLAEGRKWLVVVDDQNRPLGLVDRQILLRAVAAS